MQWASPFPWRLLIQCAVAACVASGIGACQPGSKPGNSSKPAPHAAASKTSQTNSTTKTAFLNEMVVPGDEKLSQRTSSSAQQTRIPAFQTGFQSSAQNTPDWTQPGQQPADPAAVAPSPPPIADVPANVALAPFFKALSPLVKGGAGKQLTILHLGDSHIAADRFSGDLREEFQLRFGNAGRGMLMPGLYLARGVKFEQGGDWHVAVSAMGAPGPYTITGAKVWAANRNAWMRLTATDEPFTWAEILVETGPQAGSAFVSLDGEVKRVTATDPARSWKAVRLAKTAREILIKPEGDGQVTLHSITIGTDKPGVRYVSFGLPGATASTPLTWMPSLVASDLKRLAPDLIVFAYGTEESLNDELDIADYEARANTSLALLRQAAPETAILVVGPPDIARMPPFAAESGNASDVCRALGPKERAGYTRSLRKKDPHIAHWHPPLQIDAVRAVLRRAAAANNAYFWDWSKVMGGTCGIHAWVHSEPPLAAADHVHLTEEGSKRSARLLFRELMTAFEGFSYTASTSAKR